MPDYFPDSFFPLYLDTDQLAVKTFQMPKFVSNARQPSRQLQQKEKGLNF